MTAKEAKREGRAPTQTDGQRRAGVLGSSGDQPCAVTLGPSGDQPCAVTLGPSGDQPCAVTLGPSGDQPCALDPAESEARSALAESGDRRARAEAEAARALERGDHARALEALMAGFGTDISRLCRQMIADAALAEEVHQCVFVQAYRDLGQFTGRSSFRSWLYAITRHRCLDALKVRRRWLRRFSLRSTLPELADPRRAADEALASRVAETALSRALAELRPEVRLAVLLRFRENMTYEEMAAVCGEKPATLQARVARALPVLRRLLERAGVMP